MKKILYKIIIPLFLFSFLFPISFKTQNVSATTEWYFTKTNNILLGLSAGAVEFIKTTSLEECNKKIETLQSTPNYTIGQCTEKIEAPTGEGWGYNVDTKVAPVLANNPIGFKTEENCNIDRDNYLNSDIHKNDTFFVSISPCVYKKDINNDGVVNVAPKIGATENNNIYKMLVPLPGIKCMNNDNNTNPVKADGTRECIGNNIGEYLNTIFKFGIGLCAALAVVMLIIYGIIYMGDESIFAKTEAKKKMFGAITGLIIAIGGWVLLNTINPDITGKNGLTIDSVVVPLYDRGANDPKQANGESVRCTPLTSGPCSVANLTPIFGADNAVAMSKICNMESSGVSQSSGTDYCNPPSDKSLPFSFGLFQVNLSANGALAGADCIGLFDRAVTGGDAIEPKYNNGFNCKLISGKEAVYNTCKSRLLNSTTNLAIAKSLFFNSKGIHNWDGDKKYCASAFQ